VVWLAPEASDLCEVCSLTEYDSSVTMCEARTGAYAIEATGQRGSSVNVHSNCWA